jgi:hypothetical protein
VGVVVAHERQNLARGQQLDPGDAVLAHGALKPAADRHHHLVLAVSDEAALALVTPSFDGLLKQLWRTATRWPVSGLS